jgi:uncharacterized delta-60 repeat protein
MRATGFRGRARAGTVATMANAGALDTSFSGNGKRAINFGGTDIARVVLVQPNGRIVVAGGGAASDSFCVARLLPNGKLDTAFGSRGKRVVDFGTADESAFGAALQPDGKLVLVGGAFADVAISRLNRNGSLDTSFSGDGKLTFSWGAFSRAMAVTVLSGGKLLVAGFSGPEGGDIQVARLKPGGAFDTSFGNGGKAAVDLGGTEFGLAMARQANGRILVAGRSDPTGGVVVRLRANGTLDPDFNGSGHVTLSGVAGANAVLVQPNRKIVVAGNTAGLEHMIVMRLNPSGSPDTSFGSAGSTTIDFGSLADLTGGAALQPDGKIVIAGYSQDNEKIAVARLNADGSLDSTFGNGGKALVGFGVATFGNAVALQRNGRIVVAGQRSGDDDFALARLLG